MALSGEAAVEEGDHLGAVADGVGAEGGGGQTGGDAVLHRPEDGIIEEAALGTAGGRDLGQVIVAQGGDGFPGDVAAADAFAPAQALGGAAGFGEDGPGIIMAQHVPVDGPLVHEFALDGVIPEGGGAAVLDQQGDGGVHIPVEANADGDLLVGDGGDFLALLAG